MPSGRPNLCQSKNNDLKLVGYCDFDWATCPLTRKYIFDYLMKLGNAPILWNKETCNHI